MGSLSFAVPSILFLNERTNPEHRYLLPILREAHDRGYDRFTGSAAPHNAIMLLDGCVAGVQGWDDSWLVRGAYGAESTALLHMYAMTPPSASDWRLNRLLIRTGLSAAVFGGLLKPDVAAKVDIIRTAQLTRHPEAKQLRGLMKLHTRKPDRQYGYRLVYETAPLAETPEQSLAWWMADEARYRSSRPKEGASA